MVVNAQVDFTMAAVTAMDYQVPGTKNFSVVIRAVGPAGLTNCNIGWQLDNGPATSVTKSAMDIEWGPKGGLFKDPAFKVTFPAAGTYKFKAWVKLIAPVDNNAANDTLTLTVNVMPYLPKKNVVLEVYKHQGCGPCYPAAEYNDTFIKKNNAYSVVSIYTDKKDALYNEDGATFNNHFNYAHPAPLIDRFLFPHRDKVEMSYTTGPKGYELRGYGIRELYYEPVQVWFKKVKYNTTTRELKVTVGAGFFDNLNGDYRFNLYVTEDDIKGFQSDAPDPNNYIHKHVLRAMLGGPWGKAGSLPTTIKQNDSKEYEFTYTIPATYKTEKMHLIAMVQQYTTDDTKIRILNSETRTFAQAVSVTDTEPVLSTISVYPNPAKDRITVTLPGKQNYSLQIVDMNGKVCITQQSAGNTEINVQELAVGNYILYADDGSVVHSKIIVKQ
jgi:hypothetical protein